MSKSKENMKTTYEVHHGIKKLSSRRVERISDLEDAQKYHAEKLKTCYSDVFKVTVLTKTEKLT